MTFTGRLRKAKKSIPTLNDADLEKLRQDLDRTAVVLYYGASDRVLNLCNEVLDEVGNEQARRRNRGGRK